MTDARADAFWEATEPTAPVNGVHAWHWAFDDKVADGARTARDPLAADHRLLRAMGRVGPRARTTLGPAPPPPTRPTPGAFAARYGATGTFWQAHPELPRLPVQVLEIWNEPDGAFWRPVADPAGYANMYAAARLAGQDRPTRPSA